MHVQVRPINVKGRPLFTKERLRSQAYIGELKVHETRLDHLMLRVSIHAGLLRDINRFNRVDWLDIGYEKLDAAANYKIVLFNVG